MTNQIFYDLVSGDDTPIPVRFEGIVLSDYVSITLNVLFEDTSTDTFSIVIDNQDRELGFVQMDLGGFPAGKHYGEFEFINSNAKEGTVPKPLPVVFNVRAELG